MQVWNRLFDSLSFREPLLRSYDLQTEKTDKPDTKEVTKAMLHFFGKIAGIKSWILLVKV